MTSITLESPYEPVALGSPFYVERLPAEQLVYQGISKPGCIIRIKAPSKMGKSSLLLRVMDYAKSQNYCTAYLDFQQADEANFACLDKFLRWFCVNIAYQLKLTPNLDEYWDEELGSKMSCSIYFQDYLLSKIDSPLVLTLNEVNRLFEYPAIAREFLPMLRAWYEKAKQNDTLQKLRLLIFQSTEVYITLNVNQSPFNVGISIQLPEFTTEQIQHLATSHGLYWTVERSKALSLQKMLGGHPYLVRLILYELAKYSKNNLEQLLQEAPTITGIFSNHLRTLLGILQNNPALIIALKKVIANLDGVELDHIIAYKLESIGLVKLNGDRCKIYCELYRQYFTSQNLDDLSVHDKLIQLHQENLELQKLASTDYMTNLVNRRYFDKYLGEYWLSLALEMAPISLILCEIDCFKTYCDSSNKETVNSCLQKVASVIDNLVNSSSLDLQLAVAARYDCQKFGIILPKMEALIAAKLAERIRQAVKKLAILHNSNYGGFPSDVVTITLGVACTIPNYQASADILVDATYELLLNSKRNGYDYTYVSSSLNYGLRK
jgi:diguanylate cyclase (GGDEF)-like protein